MYQINNQVIMHSPCAYFLNVVLTKLKVKSSPCNHQNTTSVKTIFWYRILKQGEKTQLKTKNCFCHKMMIRKITQHHEEPRRQSSSQSRSLLIVKQRMCNKMIHFHSIFIHRFIVVCVYSVIYCYIDISFITK